MLSSAYRNGLLPSPTQVVRKSSSLAEKIRLAGSGDAQRHKAASTSSSYENVTDSSGEQFREIFLMPKRKLRGQLQIEQATGRTAIARRSRMDLHDRLSVRKDRAEEMSPDQDWTAVWPAARTFSASVVPLPVRMGTRPDPEKRAPFKKHGNLELVKVPNFLHLTPAAIEKHCEAIKKFCTQFPDELKDSAVYDNEFPVKVEYATYVHQGTSIRDPRARVVTVKVKVAALGLTSSQREKFIRLVGKRYSESDDTLTIICDRCPTRKQNLDYAHYLLTVLFHESQKVEAWETMKERRDNLKVEFDGSQCKEKLESILKARASEPESTSIDSSDLKKFGEMWYRYRNTEETPESTRQYGHQVQQLLGVKLPEQRVKTN